MTSIILTLFRPTSPILPSKRDDNWNNLVDNNNKAGEVYSPMVVRNRNQDDNIKKMEEDSFELALKQTDPDYEAIHFSRGKAMGSNKNIKNNITKQVCVGEQVERASVLDFSSKKRELVLGIDRKPEIKPLSVFKVDKQEEMSSDEESIAEVIDVVADVNEDDASLSEEEEEEEYFDTQSSGSLRENSSIRTNAFIKSQPSKFNTTRRPGNQPVNRFSNHLSQDKSSGTTALINKFNNNGSKPKSNGEIVSKNLKTTKQLINKFNKTSNQDSNPVKIPAISPHLQRFSYNMPQQQSKPGPKNNSNVLKIVSALNKSGLPNLK